MLSFQCRRCCAEYKRKENAINDLSIHALNKLIDNMLAENVDGITQNIGKGIKESMPIEQQTGIIVKNCLSESIKISTQLILNLLEDSGIIKINEKHLAKIALTIHENNQQQLNG